MPKLKTAILMISYGTVSAEARIRTIDAAVGDVRRAFPDADVRTVFTSPLIRSMLLEKSGISVPSVGEALNQLVKEGFEQVICQPMYVIGGLESDQVREAAEAFSTSFVSLKIGDVLIRPENCTEVAQALRKEVGFSGDHIHILVGHGSFHETNDVYRLLESAFAQTGKEPVLIGTLESKPDIDDIFARLEAQPCRRAVLIPLLLFAGVHATKDIFGADASWLCRLSESGYDVDCVRKGLGEYAFARSLWVESIRRCMDA